MTTFSQFMMHLFASAFVISFAFTCMFGIVTTNANDKYALPCGASFFATIANVVGFLIVWIWS